jgi:hypothetical protein
MSNTRYNHMDVTTWPYFKPTIIAHDVGRSRDRSTAVIGGGNPYPFPAQPSLVGIGKLIELPQGLYGSARASRLAAIDTHYDNNCLIVADLSNDPTYAEVLHKTFGPRVMGLHITRHGDGMNAEWRPVPGGAILVYTIGRSYLLELFHTRLQSGQVRVPLDDEMMRRAAAQLEALQTELRETGAVYSCPAGQHDDLGISCAMLVWAAHHPHLERWVRSVQQSRQPPRRSPKYDSRAWT